MKRHNSLGLALLLMTCCTAASARDTLLYGGSLAYPGSSGQVSAAVQGVYLTGGAVDHVWETDLEHTASGDPGNQMAGDDLTAVYTAYPTFGQAWRMGLHGTSSGGGAVALFTGWRRYHSYGPHWEVDLNAAHITTDGADTAGGILRSGASVATGRGYVDMTFSLRAGAVHTASALFGSGALGFDLSWREGHGLLGLSAWSGSERYPLRQEGFVFDTDDTVRTGGLRVKYSYLGGRGRNFSLSWQEEGLQQSDGSSGDQTTLLGMVGFTW